jgi:hypothetical protein
VRSEGAQEGTQARRSAEKDADENGVDRQGEQEGREEQGGGEQDRCPGISPAEERLVARQQQFEPLVQQSLRGVEAIARIAEMPCEKLRVYQGKGGKARLQEMQAAAKARQGKEGWVEIGSQTGKDGHTTRLLRGKTGGSEVQCIVVSGREQGFICV